MALKYVTMLIKDANLSKDEIINSVKNRLSQYKTINGSYEYIAQVINPISKQSFCVVDDELKEALRLSDNIVEFASGETTAISANGQSISEDRVRELIQEQMTSLQGIKGDKGDKGEQGERGIQGIQGERGERGEKGDKGDQGEQGIQGERGLKGEKGDRGERGLKGDKGDKGDTPTLKTINGQSLIGSGDITIQTDTSSLETRLTQLQTNNFTLSSELAELTTKMGKLLRVFSEPELDELARWRPADTTQWSNVFGGSSSASNDIIRFNNAKSAFLAPENVIGIKFKLRARANPGGYILWLLCSTNRSNQSNIRALTMNMQTSYNDTYTSWIKPREGHTAYNGSHGASADDIKGVFNCHNVEITVLIENGKIKCSNALGYRFEINPFGGSGFINRLGLGSQANFSNNAEAYDIKVLTN